MTQLCCQFQTCESMTALMLTNHKLVKQIHYFIVIATLMNTSNHKGLKGL